MQRKRRTPIIVDRTEERPAKRRKVCDDERMEYVSNLSAERSGDVREKPQMQNVVCVMDMHRKFDEVVVCSSIEPADYVRHKFAAMTVRLLTYATGLVYTTGKFIGVGTFSELATRLVGIMYMNDIGRVRERSFRRDDEGRIDGIFFRPISNGIRANEMHMVNTVFKFRFGASRVYLDEIHKNTLAFSAFSPEAFPGVRIRGKTATFTVFQNGWCLILGLSNAADVQKAHAEVARYISDAHRTHRSSNVLSKYIWQRTHGVAPATETREEAEAGAAYDPSVDKSGHGFFSGERSAMVGSSTARGSENFERRLTDHYAWGSYVSAEDFATHILMPKVRERVQLADFVRCLRGAEAGGLRTST